MQTVLFTMLLPRIAEIIGTLKKGSALLAVFYLVYALLPYGYLGMNGGPQLLPEWASRAWFFVCSMLFAAIFYGLQKRTLVYWKVIPALIGAYGLVHFAGAVWATRHLTQSWLPSLLFGGPFIFCVFTVFILWWRKQKNYFA
jgi:hypothetical protein